jgi:hypothetical protein
MSRLRLVAVALAVVLVAATGFAQGTTGTLAGKITDEQGLALPGVTVTASNTGTGFSRSATTDSTGEYSLPGLPVGMYELKADMTGFASQSQKGISVNVAGTTTTDFKMGVTGRTEELTVVAEAPLIDVRESGVGEIITTAQIENLPLNGRQFGNLAALVPGVGLGFHTDPTKSTQFAPQAGGGGGRNINYLIDGGDNNDDTVGGLVQNFPLDSIGEFNFQTQRFKAEYGRANGGVLSVVTKSGTNDLRGSVFEYFRDKSLNSITESERLAGVEKGEYRKHQFGGSLGGPIVKDRTHFFVSVERVQQDTTQVVNSDGLFPDLDGVFDVPYRETMALGKITHQLNSNHYLSLRYGYNDNSQPYGAGVQSPVENWGDNQNKFHSANVNLNSVLGTGKLNEFVFQFSYFKNHIAENSTAPSEVFPGGFTTGQNVNTPQTTEQHKYQFRDDFTLTRGGHEFKIGAQFINEPVLDITFNSGNSPTFTHLTDDRNGPITNISQSGTVGEGSDTAKIPTKQYAVYVQDAWRATDRLTIDLGVRYEYVTGFAFDQSDSILFQELQAAGAAGRLDGIIGLEDFGLEPEEDKNNIAPRAGFTLDTKGDGQLVLRGGLGRYYDFAYTNANILFAVASAQVPHGTIYSYDDQAGIRNPDGSLFRPGQPLPPNQIRSTARPSFNHAASPRIKQPYTDQANLGFSKALGKEFAIEVDGIYARGRDLGIRPNLNVRVNRGPRRLNDILPTFGATNFRADVSKGRSNYKAVSVAFKKRWDGKLQFLTSYTLSESKSMSRRATDEFISDDIINAFDPFADAQESWTNNDARHRVTISGVWSPGMEFRIAPIFRYRSATPFNVTTGTDDNGDGKNFDLPPGGAINDHRGADFKQFDLRVSKKFKISGSAAFELIAEGFNVLNAKNPAGFVGNLTSSTFGQPTEYAGDFQRGEQRIFQFGARFEF